MPLGTRRQRLLIDVLGLVWLATAVAFWGWWLSGGHFVSPFGGVVNSAILAFEFVVQPLWFLGFARRARRPDRRGPVPVLRSAMVVTKAPSEPWPVVRRTLQAMLAQDAGVPYAVWLADERPTPETRAWCADHGVWISTRHGVRGYHQDVWPRRTRCKEGNLAFFYDVYGYARYDIVCQFDADHVPDASYLTAVLKAFDDPTVGYVAAPSICDANAERSWAARGRLYLEAGLHGAAQAGYNDGYAPCCIGSHYAVRTQALRDVGGLGPELAEDFSTSMLLSAAGWRGAFAIDATAHGDGPETAVDAATQDLQWSQSMMSLLLGHAPEALRRMARPARLRLLFCLLWYPLNAFVLLVAHLLPTYALVTGRPLVSVELGTFALHLVPCVVASIALLCAVRRAGWLRPVDAPVISWEAILFTLVRWPWTVVGCLRAVWVHVSGRAVDWKVTPKGVGGPAPLPARALAPPLLIAAASAAPVLLVDDPGEARGYLFWALFNAVVYLGVALAVLLLHLREQWGASLSPVHSLRLLRRPGLAAAAALAVVAPGVAVGADGAMQAWRAIPTLGEEPRSLKTLNRPWSGAPAIGVATQGLATNVAVPFGAAALSELDRFETATRARVGIAHFFMDFRSDVQALASQLEAIGRRGAVPQITWEPWDHRRGLHVDQPDYSLARIADGRHDDHLRSVARRIAAYGRPVRLRFAHEMDNVAYPWSERRSANRPGDYVAAWRHVRRILHAEGVTNARMVWSPLATTFDRRLFPGTDQVDVIGMSGFNGGSELRWSGWRSFADIFEPALRQARTLAPDLPVEISEVSSVEQGGDKARWIQGMWETVRRHPEIEAVLWFDLDKEADWRVTSSGASRWAFAEGAAAARSASVFPHR